MSSGNYREAIVNPYTGTHHLSGCYDLHYFISGSNNFSLSDSDCSGIYTCSISDSHGKNLDINIGLYEQGFNSECLKLAFYASIINVYS